MNENSNTDSVDPAETRARQAALRFVPILTHNISFIETELPECQCTEQFRKTAAEVVAETWGDKHDIVNELFNPDGSVDSAAAYIEEVISRCDRLVREAGEEAKKNSLYSNAYFLIAESVVNIINAFFEMRDEIGRERRA